MGSYFCNIKNNVKCYFRAVDALVRDSPWSKAHAKEGQELVFEFRESAIEFMDEMLKHKMFHR